jgi:hypothetical protein
VAIQKYSNNASSVLAVSITDVALSLQVGAGHGALFPSPTGGDFFLVTLVDSAGHVEIVKVTGRSTDVFTILRAQESTTARAWVGNACRVELRVTEGTLERFVQIDGINGLAQDIDVNGKILTDAVMVGLQITDETTIGGASPVFKLDETDAPSNQRIWRFDVAAGVLRLRTRTDVDGTGENILTATRSGSAVSQIDLGNTTSNPAVRLLGSGGLELGHATDTSLTRLSAGELGVEGNKVWHAGNIVLAAGTYSPTLVAGANMASVSLLGLAQYIRVGSIVQVSMRVNADPTAAGVCAFTASLPIPSVFADATNAHGLTSEGGEVGADVASAGLSAFWTAPSGISATVRVVATYLII